MARQTLNAGGGVGATVRRKRKRREAEGASQAISTMRTTAGSSHYVRDEPRHNDRVAVLVAQRPRRSFLYFFTCAVGRCMRSATQVNEPF